MFNQLKEKIKGNPSLKSFVHRMLIHPVRTRPRFWLRCFRFLYIERERGSVIYRSVRQDIVPFNEFRLGARSVIESFSIVNNMVGSVIIGSHSRIGVGNTIIGPVHIGKEVNLAQGVVLSGLNHNYEDPHHTIISQGVSTAPIVIEDDVWIGANVVIVAGITVGRHAVVAAGSIVNRNVPPYSIVAGNPARIMKQYNENNGKWEKILP